MRMYEFVEHRNSKSVFGFKMFASDAEATKWMKAHDEMNRDQYRAYGFSMWRISEDCHDYIDFKKYGYSEA